VNSAPSEHMEEAKQSEYLTFFIADVEWVIALEHIREVIPYDVITRVPGMPNAVRGVTNLRGSVVPVVDLAIKFNLPAVDITPRSCIVLAEVKLGDSPQLLGLLVEEVGQVLAVSKKDVLPPPSFGTPVHADYLTGVLPIGKKFGLVLNIDRTLSADEILSPSLAPPEEGETVEVDEGWENVDASNAAASQL